MIQSPTKNPLKRFSRVLLPFSTLFLPMIKRMVFPEWTTLILSFFPTALFSLFMQNAKPVLITSTVFKSFHPGFTCSALLPLAARLPLLGNSSNNLPLTANPAFSAPTKCLVSNSSLNLLLVKFLNATKILLSPPPIFVTALLHGF